MKAAAAMTRNIGRLTAAKKQHMRRRWRVFSTITMAGSWISWVRNGIAARKPISRLEASKASA
ncbi:MAG: hypothetical protein A3B62_04425 [Rhodospirillales bacterium RIFCSPLOWO2_01_FULL_65_14]|nr:MAG: hypothetical protein A3B62_04425 [Rhodospirillales bacterium RIFCSPLOWO2_01_FULL_65_14]